AVDTFREYGCGKVVLKLGKEGAMYDFDGVRGSVKNPRQFEEIDPVGAGDAFAAGIVSGLLSEEGADGLIGKACFLGGYITQFIADYSCFPSSDKHWAASDQLNDET